MTKDRKADVRIGPLVHKFLPLFCIYVEGMEGPLAAVVMCGRLTFLKK